MNMTKRGISLIETVTVIAIVPVIMIAIANSVLFFYKANTVSIEQAYQVDHARKGVTLLVRDIREASYADNGAYPLAAMASTSITFYSDTDRDNQTERITYEITGTSLKRAVLDPSGSPTTYTGSAATTSVSEYIRNIEDGVPAFRYYDKDNIEVADAAHIADVVSVSVMTVINIVTTRAPGEFTLKSSATLRNLRPQ
jgi:Tfp pilus assembly protein PilW